MDQLGRASALGFCALELERQDDVDEFGKWPSEIGLWVGKAATPNVMGQKGGHVSGFGTSKTIAFQNDDGENHRLFPLKNVLECGTTFTNRSFRLLPNSDGPIDLQVTCVNRDYKLVMTIRCRLLGVDEPIYRRLPCFMIATVDKFPAMPWTGEVGGFFGRVQRHDDHGFYGPCNTGHGASIAAEPNAPGQEFGDSGRTSPDLWPTWHTGGPLQTALN